jgi:hypothetical protein
LAIKTSVEAAMVNAPIVASMFHISQPSPSWYE